MEEGKRTNFSVNIVLQSAISGGNDSMYFRNDNKTAHSLRSVQQTLLLDGFYDPKIPEAFAFVKNWTNENDKGAMPGGIYSNYDRRFLGFAYAREDDPNNGVVLDTIWEKYYDSREKYDKLITIKRKFDPDYIFTANSFGVDASNAPEKKCVKITAKN